MKIDHLLCFVAEQLMTGNERERNGFLPGERQNRISPLSFFLFQDFFLSNSSLYLQIDFLFQRIDIFPPKNVFQQWVSTR